MALRRGVLLLSLVASAHALPEDFEMYSKAFYFIVSAFALFVAIRAIVLSRRKDPYDDSDSEGDEEIEGGDESEKAHNRIQSALQLVQRGKAKEARLHLEALRKTEIVNADPKIDYESTAALAMVCDALKDVQAAQACRQRALLMAYQLWGTMPEDRTACFQMGARFYQLGEFPRAAQLLQRSLDMCLEVGDHEGQTHSARMLALACIGMRDNARAAEMLNLSLRSGYDDRPLEAAERSRLARLYSALRRPRDAAAQLAACAGICRALSNEPEPEDAGEAGAAGEGEEGSKKKGGSPKGGKGDEEQFDRAADALLAVCSGFGDDMKRLRWEIMQNIAAAQNAMGQPGKAAGVLQQLLDAQCYGSPAEEQLTRNALGAALLESGQPKKAVEMFEAALKIQEPAGVHPLLINLSSAYLQLNEPMKSISLLEQCLEFARRRNDREGGARALLELANIFERGGHPDKAQQLREQAGLLRAELQPQPAGGPEQQPAQEQPPRQKSPPKKK